jgi:hypothetical protein
VEGGVTEPWDVVVAEGEFHRDEWGATMRWKAYSHRLEFDVREGTRQLDGSVCYSLEAENFVRGSIKWDGCSHVWFGDDDGYLHLCGGFYIRALGEILREAFALAGANVPEWDAKVAR